jgi:SNF2 family DNA or RNA helicase
MTGTPILNKPQELFSMLFLVNKHMFPNESTFLHDYCYQAGPNKWRFMPGGLARLTNYMSKFFLQRNRDDAGIHVPPPAITVHTIEKDKVKYHKQYEAERTVNEQAALLLEDGTRKDIFYVLELILRARQCMTWPAGITIKDPDTDEVLCHFDVNESQKLDEVTALIEELLEEEERVIVFSQFKAPLYEMKNRLAGQHSVVLATGDQSGFHKEQVRKDFDLKTAPVEPRWSVCFATYKAFGTGINLNAARHVILLDDEWNPGMEDQAIGRIDRMNSVDQANVHIFRVESSIDDFMAGILEEKRGITDGFDNSINQVETLKSFFTKDN